MSNRKQRRQEEKWNKNTSNQLQFTTSTSDEYFRLLVTKALKGELSPDEWSRLTPALKKKMERFAKKAKSIINDPNFFSSLPQDAIIKSINTETEGDDENMSKDSK